MNNVHELLSIQRSIDLEAPRARVWRALTRAEEFAQWFGVKMSGEFAPGARVEMETTHEQYAGMRWPVYIERMEPESLFSWRWHPGAENPEHDNPATMTLVTFTLEEIPAGTRLTVRETGFDRVSLAVRAKAIEDNTSGWEQQLASIAAHVQRSS